ncbi:hypothetical protein Cgig2_024488 [Carnegiea gigantea]|uniref:26S proteasome complex subunit SEM1 n=1 Tax=Carnegiea gigantea TaxID=171969 RepID=A0A9Q1KL69_9CARY|nr:hypothetical protein Cgig2_024488 [Carnegiea gigantea]
MATNETKPASEEAKMDLFEDDDEFEEFEIDLELWLSSKCILAYSSAYVDEEKYRNSALTLVLGCLITFHKGKLGYCYTSFVSNRKRLVFGFVNREMHAPGIAVCICSMMIENTRIDESFVLDLFLVFLLKDKSVAGCILNALEAGSLRKWDSREEGKEVTQQWEDDWDDDDVNDDFSLQLRRELESNAAEKK